jgi:hypothetical protein
VQHLIEKLLINISCLQTWITRAKTNKYGLVRKSTETGYAVRHGNQGERDLAQEGIQVSFTLQTSFLGLKLFQ